MTLKSTSDIHHVATSVNQSLSELEVPKFSFVLVITEAKKAQGTYRSFTVGMWQTQELSPVSIDRSFTTLAVP